MKLFMFRTNKPRKYNYIPRFYNPEKEALEKRKAALGLDSSLTDEEKLRLRMSSRWRKQEFNDGYGSIRRITFIAYGTVVLLGIYVVFFTDLIDNLIRAFGIGK